jgi:hypothetical protein
MNQQLEICLINLSIKYSLISGETLMVFNQAFPMCMYVFTVALLHVSVYQN